jgi:hypothetical protein
VQETTYRDESPFEPPGRPSLLAAVDAYLHERTRALV